MKYDKIFTSSLTTRTCACAQTPASNTSSSRVHTRPPGLCGEHSNTRPTYWAESAKGAAGAREDADSSGAAARNDDPIAPTAPGDRATASASRDSRDRGGGGAEVEAATRARDATAAVNVACADGMAPARARARARRRRARAADGRGGGGRGLEAPRVGARRRRFGPGRSLSARRAPRGSVTRKSRRS